MKPRRRQVKIRLIALTVMNITAALLLFLIIIFFIVSEVMNKNARTTIENPEWYFSEERLAELEKEEKEAIKKALEEKIAKSTGIIYLTFDDGPSNHTASLLDVLKKHDIKATFFVTGYGSDEIIKREYEEGHTVGLHTWSHKYDQVYINAESYFADLAKISDRVKNITGEESKIIRFPGGSSNTVSTRYDHGSRIMSVLASEVEKRGYHYYDWNVNSDDAGSAKTADAVYTNVTTHLKGGPNVVLQHDTKDFSVEAVERIIEFGLANNYVFMPIDFGSYDAHHRVNN